MTSYVPPKKNAAHVFYAGLEDRANPGLFKVNPTIAAGDFKVSLDDGTLTNLTTLPAVTPAGSRRVKFSLSAAEMNGDNVTVVGSDAAGAEWLDFLKNIQTAAYQIDDIGAVTAQIDTSAVTVATSNDAGELTIQRSATFAATVSGLTIPSNWTAMLWTLKDSETQADTEAILQVRESNSHAGTDGLQRILGSAPTIQGLTAAAAALTVNQVAGTVAISVAASATVKLYTGRVWDLKVLYGSGAAEQLATGTAEIVYTVTHAVS
jgi:hypothetical protein